VVDEATSTIVHGVQGVDSDLISDLRAALEQEDGVVVTVDYHGKTMLAHLDGSYYSPCEHHLHGTRLRIVKEGS